MDIRAALTRKAGPFPVWVYGGFAATFFLAWYYFRKKTAAASTSADGADTTGSTAGMFTSSQTQTTTNPSTGDQSTTSYQASGPGIGTPAQYVTAAGPMPYSGGDVYVNYPGGTTTTPPPTGFQPAMGDSPTGFWYVVAHDSQGEAISQEMTDELKAIQTVNPHIDWTGLVHAGTPIWIPMAPDAANALNPAPPPTQTTNQLAA